MTVTFFDTVSNVKGHFIARSRLVCWQLILGQGQGRAGCRKICVKNHEITYKAYDRIAQWVYVSLDQ